MNPPRIITKEERAARRESKAGLGDAVAAIATPVARALGLPCVDPATKQLRPESRCAKRKAGLNQTGAKVKLAVKTFFGSGNPNQPPK